MCVSVEARGRPFLLLSTLLIETGLSLNQLDRLYQLARLAGQPTSGIHRSALPLGLQTCVAMPRFSCGCWESKQVFMCLQQGFHQQSHLPSHQLFIKPQATAACPAQKKTHRYTAFRQHNPPLPLLLSLLDFAAQAGFERD